METGQAKIYHHQTPRKYLLPWADADERIAWYGYGKVTRSGLTVVGGEDNFYKLKELTPQDIDCMKVYIDGLPELGRATHKDFLRSYTIPTQIKRKFDEQGINNPESRKIVDVAISNLQENFYAAIENLFWPYLDLIKARDFSFLEDTNGATDFFHGLAVQYMRTKAVKERAIKKQNVLFDDIERVWGVLSYITAVEIYAMNHRWPHQNFIIKWAAIQTNNAMIRKGVRTSAPTMVAATPRAQRGRRSSANEPFSIEEL